MNNEFKDYYRILGVTPDASMRNIEVARDRELNESWNDPSRRLLIQEAYTVLSNPESRRNYNIMFNQMISERDRAILNARTYEELRNAQNAYPSVSYVAPIQQPIEKTDISAETPVEEEEKKEEATIEVGSDTAEETPVEEEEKQEESIGMGTNPTNLVEERPIPIDRLSPQQKEEIKKSQKIAGLVAAGVLLDPGVLAIGIPVAIIAKKISEKLKHIKLQKAKKEGNLTEIQTQETKLFEQYNEKLEEQIYNLLSSSHSDYNLEIAILKYRNQVELLKNRIDLKKTQNVKKGGVTKFKLELRSLEKQLEKTKKTLLKLEAKVGERKKQSKLSKLNDNLYENKESLEKATKELEPTAKSEEVANVKNLQVQFDTLKKKRDKLSHKKVLRKDRISSRQAFLVAFDIQKKKITDRFNNNSSTETKTMEEESVKTR